MLKCEHRAYQAAVKWRGMSKHNTQQMTLFAMDDLVDEVPVKEEKRKGKSYEMTCVVCASTFLAKSKRAKYCSKGCRSRAQKIRREAQQHHSESNTEAAPAQGQSGNHTVISLPASKALMDISVDAKLLHTIVENQQAQIEQLRAMVQLQQQMLDAVMHQSQQAPSQRALQGQAKLTPLTFNSLDDDLSEVRVRKVKAENDNSSQNFLNSLMALQG